MSKKIEVKRTVDLTSAVSVIEDIVASLKVGSVCVQKGADYVTVTPVGDLYLEIEAKQKKDRETLSIELGWKVKEEAVEEAPVEEFKISSTEPVVVSSDDESIA